MAEDLAKERKARRESMKGLHRITIADSYNLELVEDIVAAAPEVQVLTIEITEGKSFDLSLLRELEDLLLLKITEGPYLKKITLDGIQEFEHLTGIEINVNPESPIEDIDLTPLASHPELYSVTIACPLKKLSGLEILKSLPKLGSIGLYSLDNSELDLSVLSGCKTLTSIYLGDLGPENPTKPYLVTLPKDIPLKVFQINGCYSSEIDLNIDFSIFQNLEAIDRLELTDCQLKSFDLNVLSPLSRIGSINLSKNNIGHLDISGILEKPMFTEQALGEPPFLLDSNVILEIPKKMKDEIPNILGIPDREFEEHDGEFAIDPEFGHQWLKKLLDDHPVEWIG